MIQALLLSKGPSWQTSFWANVFWANVFLGKCPSGQMPFWANILWPNVVLGKFLWAIFVCANVVSLLGTIPGGAAISGQMFNHKI
jgi:hypothetical protein